MICPSCTASFYFNGDPIVEPSIIPCDCYGGTVEIEAYRCPECGQFILYAEVPEKTLVYPHVTEYEGLKYVPESLRRDFLEARQVLDVSPKASAMLSRRCLQHLIRDHMGIKRDGGLSQEIHSARTSGALPPYIADDLEWVRVVGNFAAHPEKNRDDELVEVEPGEAEWSLRVLEGLFDIFFAGPEKARERREALNQKMERAGRRPLAMAPVIPFPRLAANE